MKKIISIFLAMSLLFLTGCQSNNILEVRDRAYIQSAAFSGKNNMSLTIYPFEEEKEQSKGVGATIAEAVENAAAAYGKDVFMGHLELLCFDEVGFTEKLESCLLDYRMSPSCKLLFIKDIDIPENCDMTLLTDRLTMEEKKGHIPETDLLHILSEKKSADSTALVPVITKNGLSMCILKNGNEPYILSQKSAEGLCWLRGENYPERISVQNNGTTEDYEIYSAKTKISAQLQDNIPLITVNISVKGSGNTQAAKNIIESRCNEAMRDTLKTAKADVIGFSKCLAKYCPEYYAGQDFETAKWASNFQCNVEFD